MEELEQVVVLGQNQLKDSEQEIYLGLEMLETAKLETQTSVNRYEDFIDATRRRRRVRDNISISNRDMIRDLTDKIRGVLGIENICMRMFLLRL